MILFISGTRNINPNEVYVEISEVISREFTNIKMIIHGNAIGVDQVAQTFALRNGIDWHIEEPNYLKYPSKAAPVIRNKNLAQMCDKALIVRNGKITAGTKDARNNVQKLGKAYLDYDLKTKKATWNQQVKMTNL